MNIDIERLLFQKVKRNFLKKARKKVISLDEQNYSTKYSFNKDKMSIGAKSFMNTK